MSKSVLLIDDSRLSRMMISKELTGLDLDISEASGGQEGIDLYKEQKADIVFLDLTMPDMDGFETLKNLLQIDPDAKVVILTADVQSGSTNKALEMGAFKVMNKPSKREEFEAVLEESLK
ncbi:response regulator [Thermodesulfobacteriota bacterium]